MNSRPLLHLNTRGCLLPWNLARLPTPTWTSATATTATIAQKRWGSQVPTASTTIGPSNFTKAQAVMMIQNLSVEERKMFLKELKKVARSRDGGVAVPSSADLRQLAYHNSLPFVGFGFLDNFVMIIAGEYIELSLGMKLGISTMAAAALGNTISDLVGIGSAWYVESFAHKLGAHPPDLTAEQLEMTRSRVCGMLGRALGIVVGCLLGMFPLLFIDTSKDTSTEEQSEDNNNS